MLILIHLDRSDPPSGTIALPRDPVAGTNEGSLVEFIGWLGMLHALQEVMDSRSPADATET